MKVVGVDEAGRGSFVGPLVVGGFALDSDRLAEVRACGARDSKELVARERERVYGELQKLGECAAIELSPRTVDRAVRIGGLNELEAATFGAVIRKLAGEEARVDACDANEARFGRKVASRAGAGVRVIARHHADRDEPIVGAASIVAKVRRDRAIAELQTTLGADLGSGYPSDERTVAFVRTHLQGSDAAPSWLRTSWATMIRVKPAAPAAPLDRFVA
jgi:ribonuclease HII